MNHLRITPLAIAAGLALCMPSIAIGQVEIEWVTVGNAGNPADPTTGFGRVCYEYRIGKYEVTNDQYAAFLNAVAASDPNNLYNTNMGSNARGGITRSGSAGSYTYSVKPNMGNKPVNFVSWYDAARMSNWLTNGQGTGDTETGTYTLTGPTSISEITRDLRNPNQVFLPTENEWYKAAFHQPFNQGGDADNYWLYATRSNAVPTIATGTVTGDIANPGVNVVNYNFGVDWNGQDGNLTTVGSAGNSSYHGAFDMNGNVYEWNETLIGSNRGNRGGAWDFQEINMRSTNRDRFNPAGESDTTGFRLASPLPGPCTGDIADDFGTTGADGQVSFGDFLALLGLVGPCPGGTPGCIGDIADDFGSPCRDGQVSFGDFLALLGLIGPCP
jgi:formylglycine-generating enzyme